MPSVTATIGDGTTVQRRGSINGNWGEELAETHKFFEKFGKRLPQELWTEHEQLGARLQRVAAAT